MGLRYNRPPGWPPAPKGFVPGPNWRPDPSWPDPPPGWQVWIDDGEPSAAPAQAGSATRRQGPPAPRSPEVGETRGYGGRHGGGPASDAVSYAPDAGYAPDPGGYSRGTRYDEATVRTRRGSHASNRSDYAADGDSGRQASSYATRRGGVAAGYDADSSYSPRRGYSDSGIIASDDSPVAAAGGYDPGGRTSYDDPPSPYSTPDYDGAGAGYDSAGYDGAGYDGAGYDGAGYDGAGYDGGGDDGAGYDGAGASPRRRSAAIDRDSPYPGGGYDGSYGDGPEGREGYGGPAVGAGPADSPYGPPASEYVPPSPYRSPASEYVPPSPYGPPASEYAGPADPYGAAPMPPGSPYDRQGPGRDGMPDRDRPRGGRSGWATASLIFGLIGGAALGIIFGIIALVRIPRLGQRGKGLAVTGIILSCIWIVIGAVLIVNVLGQAKAGSNGQVVKGGNLSVFKLKAGDCFDNPTGSQNIATVSAIPCTQPHNAQVYSTFSLSGADSAYPADITKLATNGCNAHVASLNQNLVTKTMTIRFIFPEQVAWQQGERTVNCLIVSPTRISTSLLNS